MAFLTFALATGLIVVFGVNLPFVLTEGTFGELRVRVGPPGSGFLLETFVLLLITPVLAIEAIPVALAIHILAISVLYAFALER
ncbi:MAG: hypothetical protein V3W28_03335, partial [Thermoplasmata archaeon]